MNGPPPLGPIVGDSQAIRRARAFIERYAPTALPILLVGATGTGKELLARHIHASSRRAGRFVGVNCGALPREMAEGLLFGYERGAFSGAVRRHRGHVECADRGTLFLDELLSLSPDIQAKLLRALDNGEVQRLGDEMERYVDIRVVGALQCDVQGNIAFGTFRTDLYQRLAGVIIRIPPLFERPEDLLPLATHFAAEQGKLLEPDVIQVLRHHTWPGNARELRHVLERATCLDSNGTVSAAAVHEELRTGILDSAASQAPGDRRRSASLEADRQELLTALASTGWHGARAAATLGIHRVTLFRRLKRCGLSIRAGGQLVPE